MMRKRLSPAENTEVRHNLKITVDWLVDVLVQFAEHRRQIRVLLFVVVGVIAQLEPQHRQVWAAGHEPRSDAALAAEPPS